MVYVPSAGAPCPRPIRIIADQSCQQAGWSSLSQCCPGITAVGLHALSVLRSSLSEPDEHSPLLSGLGSCCDCRQCWAPRPRRCLRVTYVRWWTSSAMLISLWSPECMRFASSSRDHSRHSGQCSGSLSQSAGVGGVAGASSCRMSVSDTLHSVRSRAQLVSSDACKFANSVAFSRCALLCFSGFPSVIEPVTGLAQCLASP